MMPFSLKVSALSMSAFFLRLVYARTTFKPVLFSCQCLYRVNVHLVHTQNFAKNNISYSVIRTRTCMYQRVRNVSFLENPTYTLNDSLPGCQGSCSEQAQ